MSEIITLFESPWLGLYRIGHWDFVKRPNADACVGILAITDAQEIILVEQERIPVGIKVIEIPAGLVGDEQEHKGEPLSATASRELLEETGYTCETITQILKSPTSAGMSSEYTYIFHAQGLTRQTQGGGVAGEQIIVHHVPIDQLRLFLAEKENSGYAIDFKIHAALAAAGIPF